MALGVVPDDQAVVLDLLGDQAEQMLGDDAGGAEGRRGPCHFTSPFSRSCLPMDDHSYLPSSSSSQYAFASFQGTSSRSGAMFRTTPSLRSGSRCRFAARRSLSSKSRSSERNSSCRSISFSSLLAPLPRGPRLGPLGAERLEAALFQADLRLDVVQQRLEEDVLVEPVVVEPEGVVLLRRLEQPVDRGLAAALGVAGDVVVPEAALARLAEVVPQFLDAENLAGFLLDGVGPVLPDQFEDFADPANDVVGVVGVIDEDAVPVDLERVASGVEWQEVHLDPEACRVSTAEVHQKLRDGLASR